jgi:hypothetical protein
MHIGRILVGGLLIAATAASAAGDEHYLQIKGVGRDGPTGPLYLQATGDLDGDGVGDEAIVRLMCTGGELSSADYQVKGPRDAASGMASGKRTHKPVTFVKEWGPATPQLMAMKPTYDVKKVEGTGAKTMAEDSWHQVTLANAGGLCPAAEAAAAKITKSRSNIQNN